MEQKGFQVEFDYRDVLAEAHNTAFTAAKAMQLDVLETLKEEIAQSLQKGESFADFQKNVVPKLVKKGWWGEQKVFDPKTGEEQVVQVGSSRLQRIFQTNASVAQSEGQEIRIQDGKNSFPFVMYSGCNSRVPREPHCRLNELILSVDDPRRLMIKPPKGYGCKCKFIQLTTQQARAFDKGITLPEPVYKMDVNPRTGERKRIPTFRLKSKTGDIIWKPDPTFVYEGSWYDHLLMHLQNQAQNLPPVKRSTERAIKTHQVLSRIGFENRQIRASWAGMSVEERISTVKKLIKNIRQTIRKDELLLYQQKALKEANRLVAKAAVATKDKQIMVNEAMFRLGEIIGMLENLPLKIQNVITTP